jgi:hypothetical protein
VAAGGTFTYGIYPDIEGLVQEQAAETDAKKREATLGRRTSSLTSPAR